MIGRPGANPLSSSHELPKVVTPGFLLVDSINFVRHVLQSHRETGSFVVWMLLVTSLSCETDVDHVQKNRNLNNCTNIYICIYVYNYDMFPKHINNQTNPSNLEDSEGYIAHNSSDLFLSHDLSTSGLLSRNFHSASAPGPWILHVVLVQRVDLFKISDGKSKSNIQNNKYTYNYTQYIYIYNYTYIYIYICFDLSSEVLVAVIGWPKS